MKYKVRGWRLSFVCLLGMMSLPAFAVDQVFLTNGAVVQGTVLNDVPNRHVDIRLKNGTTRRIPKSEVSSVERDVPSGSDSSMLGNESRAWFSVLGGAALNIASSTSTNATNLVFDFGAKLGWTATKFEFAWLAVALSYDYVGNSSTNSIYVSTYALSSASHDLNLQLLLTRVGASGFYFGPLGGLAIYPSATVGTIGTSSSTSDFEAGAVAGYELFLSKTLSFGPDVRFVHVFGRDANLLKFALQVGLHF